ncbi:MAG: alpha/beta hydrolase [Parafilimonas sp.]|nr:alpha/beta hydrolase [Parafilimonas sp.]
MKLFNLSPAGFLVASAIVFAFISCSKNTGTTLRQPGAQVKVISNVQYGSNKDILGNTVDLALDVYIPAGATPSQKFPFILFVHGGGFTAGDKSSSASIMQQLAQAGFVAASIDYRVDSAIDGLTDPCTVDTITSEKTVYMSVQDAKAAMRFMVANAAKYNIDTTKIFLDGNSAGAITVLNSYFLTQADFNARVPGIQTLLGGVNNADNNITASYKVIGIAANSGCLPDPAYITSSNVVPIIFFQGGQDSVIPLKQGHAYYCPNTLYIYGTLSLYNRVTSLGTPAVIHIDPEGGHGPYSDDFLTNNEICFFNSILSEKPESGSYSAQESSCH